MSSRSTSDRGGRKACHPDVGVAGDPLSGFQGPVIFQKIRDPGGRKPNLFQRLKTDYISNRRHGGRFEVAMVLSNDFDLLEPIKIVREQLGKKVGILNAQKNPSRALLPHIDFIKQIRGGVLRAAQFPATLTDATGTFTKPRQDSPKHVV